MTEENNPFRMLLSNKQLIEDSQKMQISLAELKPIISRRQATQKIKNEGGNSWKASDNLAMGEMGMVRKKSLKEPLLS